MTGWPVVKAMNDVTANMIVMFLIEEIFMHYNSSKELLSDNDINLKAQVVEYYLQKLTTLIKIQQFITHELIRKLRILTALLMIC